MQSGMECNSMRKFAIGITMLLLAATAACAQMSASGSAELTGTITGRVFAEDTQKPVRFCTVNLTAIRNDNSMSRGGGSGYGGIGSSTNVNGAFTLNVAPGEYYVSASQAGYIQVNAPTSSSESAPPQGALVHVVVQANQTVQADITIQRGATISGHLSYDDGTPAVGMNATAVVIDTKTSSKTPLTARADDRGEYRINGLPDGKYTVRVQASYGYGFTGNGAGGARSVQFPTYYGNTLIFSQATTFEIHSGDDRSGTDLTVPVTSLRSLSGFVQADGTGRGLSGMNVTISLKDPTAPPGGVVASTASFSTYTLADGSFKFDGLPDGDYFLNAQGGTEGPPGGIGRRTAAQNGVSYKPLQITATVQNGDSSGNVLSLQTNN
jgi:hypothetical protein